jgi:hypothetical protein
MAQNCAGGCIGAAPAAHTGADQRGVDRRGRRGARKRGSGGDAAGQWAMGLHGDDGGAGRHRCARALTRLAVQATDMSGGVGSVEAGKTV